MVYRVSNVQNLLGGLIDARRFYDSEKAIVAKKITIQPGGKFEKHSSKEFALLFVISGKAKVVIENDSYELERDSLIEFPQNIIHSVENTGDTVAEVLVVKIK